MKTIATTLGVARSHLHDRLKGASEPCLKPPRAKDTAVVQRIQRLVGERPTYGYRRITALLNRELVNENKAKVNHKRVYRLMKEHNFLLTRYTAERPGRRHDGKVVVMCSNVRWCSDALEFSCWNGEIIRIAFALDAHDREIISWRAVAGGGISGDMIRDIMLDAVVSRFDALRAPHPVEWLSDNGSPYTAKPTRDFAAALNLVPCFTPVASPESNGMSEAFVKTFKRDYVRIATIPDARTTLSLIAGWIEDYNENHPHSGLKMHSPREYRRAHS